MIEEQSQVEEITSAERPAVPGIPPELKNPGEKKTTPRQQFDPPLGNARELAGIGIEITGSMIGLGALGWGVDLWLGCSPWGIATGLILGIIGGMYNAIKKALKITNSSGYEYQYKKLRNNPKNGRKQDRRTAAGKKTAD